MPALASAATVTGVKAAIVPIPGFPETGDILGAAPNVEFENTNYLGRAKKYSRLVVPHGGYIYPAFDLNHSYEDCDVFVSLAKMKEHATAGITLSMKNCFGLTPATIYGSGAGVDEPSVKPSGGRSMVHAGDRQPSKSAPAEKDPATYRAVIARHELAPHTSWMIGNSPKSDINPALAAGLHAVFLFHKDTWVLEHAEVDAAPSGQHLLELDSFAKLNTIF